LRDWMAGVDKPTPLSLLGHHSGVLPQPKGVVLIIAPWNFPVNLNLIPLVSAVAAGNVVVMKPSEHAPHTAAVLARIVERVFPADEVILFQGGVEVSEALLDLPFNHIFFTGSPAIGKLVMAKASRHLASVTLELGGKSPAIVDRNADVRLAARRIAWGKFLNSGQICIAPDYVLVEESRKEAFLEAIAEAVRHMYGEDPSWSPDYGRIVNERHFRRLEQRLDEARAAGATFPVGGQTNAGTLYVAPTVVDGLAPDSPLLEEEIFGPILPVIAWKEREEALRFIHDRPKPLALYVFTGDKASREYFVGHTRSGGVAVNTTLVHFFNNELPFGGDNHSGIGKAHGHYGFLAFSNERAIIRQRFRWAAADIITPPYTPFVERMAKLMSRFL
jgi:aldehyde dehydrogenase (NAD+)